MQRMILRELPFVRLVSHVYAVISVFWYMLAILVRAEQGTPTGRPGEEIIRTATTSSPKPPSSVRSTLQVKVISSF
jgi:hypothetical protein